MSISYDSDRRIFKLDTAGSSYVMEVYGSENYLTHLYYGAKIPDSNLSAYKYKGGFASFECMNYNVDDNDFSVGVATMEYPCEGTGDFRDSALAIRNSDGNRATDMRYVSHKIYAGKPGIEGLPALHVEDDSEAETLEILAEDKVTGMQVILYYTVFEKLSAMTRSVKVINASDKGADIDKVLSCCLDFNTADFDVITLYGKWYKERTLERNPLSHSCQGIASKRGSSGHCHNPFGAIVDRDATEDSGNAYGFNFVYSSNFTFSAQADPYGGARVLMGINPDGFSWHLEPGESFSAPEVVMVYSGKGLGEMSRTFHKLYQKHLFRGKWKDIKRPLLINNWEATGMSFTGDLLVTFAERAKEFGMDMLVMDDGWFGHRNDDTSSLGDWYVDEEKMGGPLSSFVEKINDMGLKFGIWFEPEMISRDSDLYRAHPDWCIHVPGREKSIARHQYVLDFGRKEVRDYIYSMMYKVLSSANIAYVKWDFNRNLSEVGSAGLPPERQGETLHRQMLGVYDVMNRLTSDFPDLLLENCSGGGGRFDPGMMYYSPQIWCSDDTDPIERLTIQFGSSLCYPASTMGAHVSKSSRAGYRTKGNIALWGTFGYELDPNKFTDDEKEIVRDQVGEYHKYYDIIHKGDLYRLINPTDNHWRCAWMFVSGDKTEALVTSVVMRRPDKYSFYLKLKGLDPDKYYVDDESGEVYSGALLMNAGLCCNRYGFEDGDSFKVYLRAL